MANPYFNAVYYLQQNPDVFSAGYTVATAWDHYVKHGANEANVTGGTFRAPNPWFDVKYYLANNPDLVRAGITPATALDHFLTFGSTAGEDRAPNATIAAAPITEAKLLAYAKANADLQTAFGISASATTLTAAQQTSLLNHFYAYGYNESRADAPAVVTIPDVDAGKTFTLTTAIDNLTGTAGNDIFLGDNTTSNPADTINGGAGNDTLKLYSTATLPNISNIENVYVNNGGANLSVANIAGVQTLTADADGAARTYTVAQGQSVKLMNNTVGGTVTGGTAVTSLNLGLENVRGGNVNTNLANLTTLNLTSSGTGARNSTTLDNDDATGAPGPVAHQLRTLNIEGNQAITLVAGTAAGSLRTVDASKMTAGGVNIDLAANAQNLTVTGSGFNDRVALNAVTQLTSADKIDFGAGKDTLALGTAVNWTAAGALTAGNVSLIQAVKNLEVLEMSALNVAALDASLLSVTEYVFSGDATTAGAGAPTNLAITKASTADNFVLTASRDGVTGAAGSGNAISIQGEVAGQAANFSLSGGVTITGADVAATDSAITSGTGISKLVINSTTTGTAAVTNSIVNAGVTTANFVINNAEAQEVVITGASNLTIGIGASGATFAQTVNLDASAFTGTLRVGGSNSTVTGDIIKLGSGNDTLQASQGADLLTLGAGNDTVVYTAANQSLTSVTDSAAILSTIDKIQDWGVGADRIDVNALAGAQVFKALTNTQFNSVKDEANLLSALTTVEGITATNDVTFFQFGGNTYVFADLGGTGATLQNNLLVQLVGEHTLTAESFVL